MLNQPAKTGYDTTEYIPVIADSPSYVMLKNGCELSVILNMKQSVQADVINMLMVNTKSDGDGLITIVIDDDVSNAITLPENSVTVGEWIRIPLGLELVSGQRYRIDITAEGCSPYFIMTSTKEISRTMPFTECIALNGQVSDTGISLGFSTDIPRTYKYSDIFYFSLEILILLAIAGLVFIWAGKKPFTKLYDYFGFFTKNYLGIVFLIIVFIFSAVTIMYRAASQGICITSDSAGYLREAVAMANGHGFSYDGVAGYNSWFANWPILYPLLICVVMKVTTLDAYLSSKILAILLVGVILLILKSSYKKDAWFYALALINLGFLEIAVYTWSELLFMVFLLGFGLSLSRINKTYAPKWYDFVLLGAMTFLTFLTRYFGIFLYAVLGLYILVWIYMYLMTKDLIARTKCIGLIITSAITGVLTVGYMALNRLKNGMASGVSRGMWWDDYETLTNDLVDSLLTELFNAFRIDIPQSIASLSYEFKVIFILLIVTGLIFFVVRSIKNNSQGIVFIMMALIYYCMFIVIRYRSSMDTFYFRFFEPATFILTIGIVSILVPRFRDQRVVKYIGIVIAAVLMLNTVSMFKDLKFDVEDTYYGTIQRTWDEAYSDIPDKSVVIFSDFDFRSSYYRADVVDGTISPSDTLEDIQNRYYGSDYMCLLRNDAKVMMDEGDYDLSVREVILNALDKDSEGRYITCELR